MMALLLTSNGIISKCIVNSAQRVWKKLLWKASTCVVDFKVVVVEFKKRGLWWALCGKQSLL